LQIEGFKGHRLKQLQDSDIVDHPAAGIIRYRWLRPVASPSDTPATTEARTIQNEGDFRLILRTQYADATGYFTVPRFLPDGTAAYPKDLPVDLNKPPRPTLDGVPTER
jgi:hypothetical protein